MRKSWWVLLIVLLCSVSFVSARVNLEISKDNCYDDGTVVLLVENTKMDPIDTADIDIVYRYEGEREEKVLNGTWDKESVYESLKVEDSEYVTFTSDQGMLTKEGDYYVKLKYKGCGNVNCLTSAIVEECQGHTNYCRNYAPTPVSCTNRQQYFYFKFIAPDRKDMFSLNEYNDYKYYLSTDKRDIDGDRKISNARLEKLDTNTYQLRVPKRVDETLKTAAITHYMCNTPTFINNAIECGEMAVEVSPESIVEKESGEVFVVEPEAIEEADVIVEETDLEEIEEPVEEEPENLPVHFYILLGMVVLGIILVILSNTKLFDGKEEESEPNKKKAKKKSKKK